MKGAPFFLAGFLAAGFFLAIFFLAGAFLAGFLAGAFFAAMVMSWWCLLRQRDYQCSEGLRCCAAVRGALALRLHQHIIVGWYSGWVKREAQRWTVAA